MPLTPNPSPRRGERGAGELRFRKELLHQALLVNLQRAELLQLLVNENHQAPQAVLHGSPLGRGLKSWAGIILLAIAAWENLPVFPSVRL